MKILGVCCQSLVDRGCSGNPEEFTFYHGTTDRISYDGVRVGEGEEKTYYIESSSFKLQRSGLMENETNLGWGHSASNSGFSPQCA